MAKRPHFSSRIHTDLKKRLEKSAQENGRSLSEEIEHRLEWSAWHDDLEKKLAEKRFG